MSVPVSLRHARGFSLAGLVLAVASIAVAAPARADAPPGVRGEFLRSLDDARNELVGLFLAIPESKYSWRPDTRQLAVRQALVHIARANYELPRLAGADVPESLGDLSELGELVHEKKALIELLSQSFAHATQVILDTPDSTLDHSAKIFGRESTIRDALLLTTTHAHEHIGQVRTYAATIGVGFPMRSRAEGFDVPKPLPQGTVIETNVKAKYAR